VGANELLKNLTMMDSAQLLSRQMGTVSTPIPTAGLVISTVLTMMTMAILAVCLSEFHGETHIEETSNNSTQLVEYKRRGTGPKFR
jgi:hypothetical protein